MSSLLNVFMDGAFCGELTQSPSGDIRFTYDDGYRAESDATPLSLSMPLALREHRKRAVLPFFDGLITDNANAREAMGRQYGVSARNPFALLTHIGADVAGALQLLPPGVLSQDASVQPVDVHTLSSHEIEEHLRAAIDEYESGRSVFGTHGRFSLAGAQPKIALTAVEPGVWGIPQGSTPTTHIFKPVSGAFRRVDVVEFITMRAAALLGLNVASTFLDQFEGTRAFVTQRYDRTLDGGRLHRLHQEDLGQSLGTPPQKKYQRDDGGPGVADIAKLFRGLANPRDRVSASQAFFDALTLNSALQCTDAHIKNYSVLLSGQTVKLAPLYDLATFAPYVDAGSTVYSAMHVAGEYRFSNIGSKQLHRVAITLGVSDEYARESIARVRENAVGAFEAARDELSDRDDDTRDFATHVVDSVARLPAFRSGEW